VALLKYGTGMPFNRDETLQANLGVPLPTSTQWDIIEAKVNVIGGKSGTKDERASLFAGRSRSPEMSESRAPNR
jgi:hypothetical protein